MIIARRGHSQGSEHRTCARTRFREGGPIGKRADDNNARAGGQVGDALWPRAHDGGEPDSLRSAYVADALAETTCGTNDSHMPREWARFAMRILYRHA